MLILLSLGTSAQVADSLRKDVAITVSDSIPTDSIRSVDSTSAKTPELKDASGLEDKVSYKASDSLRFDVKKQLVYLFGNAVVTYQKTELIADYIELNIQTNEVFARGTLNDTGGVKGKPLFKDGSQEFEATNMRYNFETKKGLIRDAFTQQGEGFVEGDKIKKLPDDVIYVWKGKFCPCEDRNARTHIKARRIKIIPDDKIVTGAANMRLGNIPTPLVLPFGIFPNSEKANSGVIIPTYGYSPGRGYFLQRGGYYWAVNDRLDATLTADIWTRGSWGLALDNNYKKRYKFDGQTDLKFQKFRTGAEETFDLKEETIYQVRWQHRQDSKAHPYGRFSADVNIVKNNRLDITSSSNQYLSNNFKSSVNYNYRFPNSPFSSSINGIYDLNTRDSSVTLTLPQTSLMMDRIYPFKRKKATGTERWYEKVSINYQANFINQMKSHQDSVFNSTTLNRLRYGINHNTEVTSNYKVMKVFSFVPYIRYSEVWHFHQTQRSFNAAQNRVLTDTFQKFGRHNTMSMGTNLSTKIYGMYHYRVGPVKSLRHVITPLVGFAYTPDYSKNPAYREYQTDSIGTKSKYNIFELSPMGAPPSQKQTGSINFELQNNFEAKVNNKKDTTGHGKKIKLIDQLNLGTSYDLFADSMNWRNMSVRANTSLFNFFNINYSSQLDFYALDEVKGLGRRVNQFEINRTGKIGRFTQHDFALSFSVGNRKSQEKNKEKIKSMQQSPYSYISIPWTLNVSYNLGISQSGLRNTRQENQAVQFTGNLQLTPGWKIEGQTGIDLVSRQLSYTRIQIYRDLNCWEATFSFVPKGGQQQYQFGINMKPAMFKDLKLNRQRNFYDFN